LVYKLPLQSLAELGLGLKPKIFGLDLEAKACERSVSETKNGAQRAKKSDERSGTVSGRKASGTRSGMLRNGNGAVSGDNKNRVTEIIGSA